jgi:hypothetical protein
MSGFAHGVTPVWGKRSTYPTRNFATLGTSVTSDRRRTKAFDRRGGHFCRPPHVAMGVGLYLHPLTRMLGVQSLRGHEDFPADCPHRSDCHSAVAKYRRMLGVSSI